MSPWFSIPVTTDLDRALGQRGWMYGYGCVRCQGWHFEGSPVYDEHIGSQDKNGIQRMRSEIVADAREVAP